jgi:hypothetical protein
MIRERNRSRDEIARIWTIDRRQVIDSIYYFEGGALMLRPEHHDMRGWLLREGERYALTYDHPCCTLARRVLRHQDELFQIVLAPGLPADDNLAERSIRPLVIKRKISGGSRSAAGTRTRLTLASLLHTWIARNRSPFVECLTALQHPISATSP